VQACKDKGDSWVYSCMLHLMSSSKRIETGPLGGLCSGPFSYISFRRTCHASNRQSIICRLTTHSLRFVGSRRSSHFSRIYLGTEYSNQARWLSMNVKTPNDLSTSREYLANLVRAPATCCAQDRAFAVARLHQHGDSTCQTLRATFLGIAQP
jgi:hypothetical protein